jgi:hypothetical protein
MINVLSRLEVGVGWRSSGGEGGCLSKSGEVGVLITVLTYCKTRRQLSLFKTEKTSFNNGSKERKVVTEPNVSSTT